MAVYFKYESLDVYKLALEVALSVADRTFPDADLRRQIVRASRSVPLNIAEGCSRNGRDRSHHFRIAAGSAAEVCAALEFVGWKDRVDLQNKLRLVDLMLSRLS